MNIKRHIVSRDENIYEAWPDVVLTDGGKLICVFAECNHHLDRTNARITLVESTDRGRTWSEKKYLSERSDGINFFNCPRISKLKDGRLAIVCDYVLEDENKNAEIHLWFGDGEGNEWGEEINLGFKAIVPDKLTELESGRWILGGQFKSAETKKLEQFLWYSDDKGKTWSDRVTVATDPALNLCETSIIEIADNTLVAFLRENSRRGYDILKCISYDGGESWGDIYATPMDCGHRPAALKLQDGRVMVTYRYIPTESHNFFGAILKTEELTIPERHKQSARIFPIDYDRNPSPDLGYSGSVQFPDGEIYVVTYIKDDSEKAHIRGYSFYTSDIELPKIGTDTRNVFWK